MTVTQSAPAFRHVTTPVSMLGCIVFWTLGIFDRVELKKQLQSLSLDGHLPKERTNNAALKATLLSRVNDLSNTMSTGHLILVKPDKAKSKPTNRQPCYEVVRVEPGSPHNKYVTVYTVQVPNAFTMPIVVQRRADSEWHPTPVSRPDIEQQRVQNLYLEEKKLLGSSQVGSMLTDICLEELDGVVLRPAGGVYWLPDTSLPRLADVRDAIRASAQPGSAPQIYPCRVERDDDALLAVTHAICLQVEQQCKVITDSIKEGELGERALNNRQDQAVQMKQQINRYERLLGKPLNDLNVKCDEMKAVAAEALLSKLT